MRKLLKRWYVWLALFLLMGLTGSGVLISSNKSRITQENFDQTQRGMTEEEVAAILGEAAKVEKVYGTGDGLSITRLWEDGPNRLAVNFKDGKLRFKTIYLATSWETLQWYAKKGAAKIGVKWD